MNEPQLISDVTALGLLALAMVLVYYALQKLFTMLTNHLERQTTAINQLSVNLMACLERLEHIQESLQKADKN